LSVLAQRLARAIRFEGPLPLPVLMTLALHDPKCGFYATGEAIGAEGAFVTAPEISQVFGELLGLWLLQTWRDQGRPRKATVVELGPGRGLLLCDALRTWRREREFLDSVEIVLVEASPALESVQRARLEGSPMAVRWVRQWSDVAPDGPLFLLANEFLDALPIRQFVKTDHGWCERMVTVDAAGGLAFALSPHPTPVSIPHDDASAGPGAVYEISSAVLSLIGDVAHAIAARGGAALFVDYGHAGDAFGDTLQAMNRHRSVGVLEQLGEADLSAHVDFGAVAKSARAAGVSAYGPRAQGAFLEDLGITQRAARLELDNCENSVEIRESIRRLLDPEQMGTLFKALALVPRDAPCPPGF
jgi:NADH dehydrogenase [ubiquinone] 1 alpha subcomplex assembly factor 7